jgi:hypothetical protein
MPPKGKGHRARERRLARKAGGEGAGQTRGIHKEGLYMTRDAARRLRLAREAARHALKQGKTLAEAAAIARTLAIVNTNNDSGSEVSADSDEDEHEAPSGSPEAIEDAMSRLTFTVGPHGQDSASECEDGPAK